MISQISRIPNQSYPRRFPAQQTSSHILAILDFSTFSSQRIVESKEMSLMSLSFVVLVAVLRSVSSGVAPVTSIPMKVIHPAA